jgi:hypothetical protein
LGEDVFCACDAGVSADNAANRKCAPGDIGIALYSKEGDMTMKLFTRKSLPLNHTMSSLTRSLLRSITLIAIFGFTLATAEASQLIITYQDPVGDQTGAIDLTKVSMIFDNATGNYQIVIRATPAHPFVGPFRININLFNPDAPVSNCVFQDTINDYNLADPITKLTLTGTNANLLAWNATDRVANNSFAGVGNPPGTSLFRSGVLNLPFTFLTNEDTITYGVTGLTTIKSFTPQDAINLLSDDITVLLESGSLNQNHANALLNKLESALDSLNQGNSQPACNKIQAFINQVNAFVNAGTLSQTEGQALIDAAEAIQILNGC